MCNRTGAALSMHLAITNSKESACQQGAGKGEDRNACMFHTWMSHAWLCKAYIPCAQPTMHALQITSRHHQNVWWAPSQPGHQIHITSQSCEKSLHNSRAPLHCICCGFDARATTTSKSNTKILTFGKDALSETTQADHLKRPPLAHDLLMYCLHGMALIDRRSNVER